MCGTVYTVQFWTPKAALAKGPSGSPRHQGVAIYGAARAITALLSSLFEVVAGFPSPSP